MKIIGHNSEALAKFVDELLSKWKVFQLIARVDVKSRVPLEEMKVPGGGIEIPYSCI